MSESLPPWVVGKGLGTDMKGDATEFASVQRFWLQKGTDRKIIFLTEGDRANVIWEHQYQVAGKWFNYLTCLMPSEKECSLCQFSEEFDGVYRRGKVAIFTIIDTHEFEDKTGKKRKNVRKLLVIKNDVKEVLERKYQTRLEDGEGLKGAMYHVFRGNSDKSSNVGDDFEFVKMIDLDAIADTSEFDYVSIFAPNKNKVDNLVKRLRQAKGEKDVVEGADKTEVPF